MDYNTRLIRLSMSEFLWPRDFQYNIYIFFYLSNLYFSADWELLEMAAS